MAGRKFYAVKKGKTTGIYRNWEECRASVEGYPGAEYKGFSSENEAMEYLGLESRKEDKDELPRPGYLLAYVDGSYDHSLRKYAFGCIFILPDGRIYMQYGNGDKEAGLQQRNVTGEMLGAMYAAKTAMVNGYTGIEIRYDYQGIEKWVTGEWRSKNELTQKYAQVMREWRKNIEICFTKVQAHANVKYNELADQTARKGLTQGVGVPKPGRLEEMEEYLGDEDADQ